MSKPLTYVIVGVVAFLAGGVASRIVGQPREPAAASKPAEVAREFAIEGMSCQGCADTITAALLRMPGVRTAKVSLADKRATVWASPAGVSTEAILAAIAAAGYKGQLAPAGAVKGDSPIFAETKIGTVPDTKGGTVPGKQPILVNLTRGKSDLHAVSMALALAQSAIKDGRGATLFLNVDAPMFAAKDLDAKLQFADFPPIKTMVADFVAAGGHVLVCGHCAHADKLRAEDLIEGARLVAHSDLFAAMTPGVAVFSFERLP